MRGSQGTVGYCDVSDIIRLQNVRKLHMYIPSYML